MTNLMRQEFEDYMASQRKPVQINYADGHGYMTAEVQIAWTTWQKAWKQALGLKDVNNLQYKIGDTLWFANGGDKLTEGKVVHIFGWGATVQYVLEYYAFIDYGIECRSGFCVSENPEGPLNLSKLAKQAGINIKKRLEERGKR